MRGISNVITALFVVAAILIAAYATMSAYVRHTSDLASAVKRVVSRQIRATYVSYGTSECNTSAGVLKVTYTGIEPEYLVRVVCYDVADPPSTFCVLPYITGGTNSMSAQYLDSSVPFLRDVELNLMACPADLNAACATDKLGCYVIGTYKAQKLSVEKMS